MWKLCETTDILQLCQNPFPHDENMYFYKISLEGLFWPLVAPMTILFQMSGQYTIADTMCHHLRHLFMGFYKSR